MKVVALSTVFVMAANSVLSQVNDSNALMVEESSHCLGLDNDRLRLNCYDELHGFSSEPRQPENFDGEWTFIESVDDFSGREDSFVYLDSIVTGRRGADFPRTLVARCDTAGG